MRTEIEDFLALTPLPNELHATEEQLDEIDRALSSLQPPVTQEEAYLLAAAFGPDSCHGLAWSLLHLIETAAPLDYDRLDLKNEWTQRLRQRFQNSKDLQR